MHTTIITNYCILKLFIKLSQTQTSVFLLEPMYLKYFLLLHNYNNSIMKQFPNKLNYKKI